MSISSAHADGASRSAADRHVRDFAFFFVTLPVLFTFDKKISFPICCSGQPDFKYFHLSIYWKYYDIITFFIYYPRKIYCCFYRKRYLKFICSITKYIFFFYFFPIRFFNIVLFRYKFPSIFS